MESGMELRSVDDGARQLRRSSSAQIRFDSTFQQKQATYLLFIGAIMGFCGFAFSFLIGFWKFLRPEMSEWHRTFPSGYGYFPSTVSEMVYNWADPAGKLFYAFEFLGSLFIFMSWYPFRFSNVFVGSAKITRLNLISWPTFRQLVPSVGMMLVATVTTTPFAMATLLDYFCIGWHLFGAVMLFAGYAVAEAYAVGFWPVGQARLTVEIIGPREKCWRRVFLGGIIFFYALFSVLTTLCWLFTEMKSPYNDKWRDYTMTDMSNVTMHRRVLVDTASGHILVLKISSYMSEVLCGLNLVMSMLTIWYYSPERLVELEEDSHNAEDMYAVMSQ